MGPLSFATKTFSASSCRKCFHSASLCIEIDDNFRRKRRSAGAKSPIDLRCFRHDFAADRSLALAPSKRSSRALTLVFKRSKRKRSRYQQRFQAQFSRTGRTLLLVIGKELIS